MRKAPQQQRSKIVVDHILGTQQCIAQYGLLHTTTPKIAEKSGVSVGSIYQYFENKDQIIEELLRRKSELLGQQLKELVMQTRKYSFRAASFP
jgi:AcrR family transcriptional regulator